jgi:hypothetical protein
MRTVLLREGNYLLVILRAGPSDEYAPEIPAKIMLVGCCPALSLSSSRTTSHA